MSLDHLFLDHDAVPTLVEVKRSNATRSRREVVAQMLDYAAGEWHERLLRDWLLERAEDGEADDSALLALLDGVLAGDPDRFWSQVGQNPPDGKLRLIFIADAIPSGLQRIVEFLNERMVPTEVRAIEVRQFVSGAQQLLQTRLVGQTVAAREVKGQSARRPAVIGALAHADIVHHGDELWSVPSIIPAGAHRPEAGDPRLRARLVNQVSRWVVEYQPDDDHPPVTLAPASAWNAARAAIEPGYQGDRFRVVHDCFTLKPGGPTLGEPAEQNELW